MTICTTGDENFSGVTTIGNAAISK